MKKIFKNPILMFILGAIIFSGITGVVALNLSASNTFFEPDDEEWEVGTVGEALNSLYLFSKSGVDLKDNIELITTNPSKDINIPVGYKYAVVVNGEWTRGGVNHLPNISIVNHTNSDVIFQQTASDYSGNYGGCFYLGIVKITDTSSVAILSSTNVPAYSVILGIKE